MKWSEVKNTFGEIVDVNAIAKEMSADLKNKCVDIATTKPIQIFKDRECKGVFLGLDIPKCISFRITKDGWLIGEWLGEFDGVDCSQHKILVQNWKIVDFQPKSIEEMEMSAIAKLTRA